MALVAGPIPAPVLGDRVLQVDVGSPFVEVLEARVDEIVAMYDRLRELGEAEKSDLLEAVDVEATGYASTSSVWSNMIKGKVTLGGCPGVEPPRSGMSTWRYSGEE